MGEVYRAIRFGLFALAVLGFYSNMESFFNVLDPSSWFFGYGLFYLALFVVPVVLAFWVSLGGRYRAGPSWTQLDKPRAGEGRAPSRLLATTHPGSEARSSDPAGSRVHGRQPRLGLRLLAVPMAIQYPANAIG